MKRNQLKWGALPLVAIAMTACSSNEELSMPQPYSNDIRFNVVSPNLTRAQSYCNNNLPTKFRVTAFRGVNNWFGTSSTLASNFDIVTGNNTDGWTSNRTQYWPEDGTNKSLNFVALVDVEDNNITYDTSDDGSKVITKVQNYVIDTNPANQKDLMYAVTPNATKGNKGDTNYGKVDLYLRHALSQICFTAQNMAADKHELTINSITLGGVLGKGDYTLPENTEFNDGAHPVMPSATEDENLMGTWAIDQTSPRQVYKISGEWKVDFTPEGEDAKITNISRPESITEGNDEPNRDHTTEDIFKNAMNVMPQDKNITPGGTSVIANDGAYLLVNISYKKSNAEDALAETKDVFLPLNEINWKQGWRYVYNLNWMGGTEIQYTIHAQDFYEDSNTSINKNVIDYQAVKMRDAGTYSLYEISKTDDGKLQLTEKEFQLTDLYIADRNVGAQKPDDAGLYFQWGYSEGYTYTYHSGEKKVTDGNGNEVALSTFSSNGYTSPSTPDDAAQKHMKGSWRMMSELDIQWLTARPIKVNSAGTGLEDDGKEYIKKEGDKLIGFNFTYTIWEAVYENSGEGDSATSTLKGFNVFVKNGEAKGASHIYFPISGCLSSSGLINVTSYGFCWGSSPSPANDAHAWSLSFGASYARMGSNNRFYGMPVRGVSEVAQ